MKQQQIIFITGCSRRIGYYLAEQFLNMGFQVVGHYRTWRQELEQLTAAGAKLLQADFAQQNDLYRLVSEVQQQVPYLSAIIHNASEFAATSSELEIAVTQFTQFMQVHMMAPMVLSRGLIAQLRDNPLGVANIIHLTDIYAERPNEQYDLYCASKAGLESLTKSFAVKYAPNIRVNSIQPGPMLTVSEQSEQQQQHILKQTLLHRMGGCEPIWQAVQFILQNDFVTGTTIKVDGGRSLVFAGEPFLS